VGEVLVAENPELYAPDHARYLNNLSMRTKALQELDEALKYAERSARIREEFMSGNPDQYAEPLTKSLIQIMDIQLALDNVAEARRTCERQIVVFRELVTRDPLSFRARFTGALETMARFCSFGAKQYEEAAGFVDEALAEREELAAEDLAGNLRPLLETLELAIRICEASSGVLNPVKYQERVSALARQAGSVAPGSVTPDLISGLKAAVVGAQIAEDKGLARSWMEALVGVHQARTDIAGLDKAHEGARVSEFLWLRGWQEESLEVVEEYLPSMKDAFESHDEGAKQKRFILLACNLTHGMILLGDARCDTDLLAEAAGITMSVVEELGDDWESFAYYVGVLLHNFGHATYRRGEIEQNLGAVEEGLTALSRSHKIHEDLNMRALCQQTQGVMASAKKVRDSLGGDNVQ